LRTINLDSLQRLLLHKSNAPRFDLINPVCILLLSITGIFFIYSAQVYTGRSQYAMQIVWLIGGGFTYLAVSLIDYRFFLRNSHWIWLGCIVLLLLLWTPLGEMRFGARRWLNLRVFSYQPSEAAKLGCLIIAASILARSEVGTIKKSLGVLIHVAAMVGLPMLLIFAQPDLGSALVIPPMVFALLYVSQLSQRFFAVAFGLFLVSVSLVAVDIYRYNKFLEENGLSPRDQLGAFEAHSWLPLRDYQRNRVLSFVAPGKVDPMGIGWNLSQSLISVGSGGLTGKGWQEGTQAKLGYLPRAVAHNDFIFSVIAEEKGFLGSSFVIALYGLLLCNGIRIAGLARDRFGALLALGVTMIFCMHILINIGMTIGLMPITGLPLPFLSYGGSFLLSCCLLQGLVQSVYRHSKDF
jgi:rod shape determining protein RodA